MECGVCEGLVGHWGCTWGGRIKHLQARDHNVLLEIVQLVVGLLDSTRSCLGGGQGGGGCSGGGGLLLLLGGLQPLLLLDLALLQRIRERWWVFSRYKFVSLLLGVFKEGISKALEIKKSCHLVQSGKRIHGCIYSLVDKLSKACLV